MVVCMSRRICVDLYEEIIALRPNGHADDDDEGRDQSRDDWFGSRSARWQHTSGTSAGVRRSRIDSRTRRPVKIVIVRDMWLTGFDAPCLHTMYADKPMQGHGLMQAIARVNRVFRDKPGGWSSTTGARRPAEAELYQPIRRAGGSG